MRRDWNHKIVFDAQKIEPNKNLYLRFFFFNETSQSIS
jgi:hypothetical protein